MSQDIIADVMNEVMNAKKAKKEQIVLQKSSKLLVRILDMMKRYGYIDYELTDGKLKIMLKELNECKAIKPRYNVNSKEISKYTRRFLPARDFGYILISTSKGLMTHYEAQENKIGGCLIAYFY